MRHLARIGAAAPALGLVLALGGAGASPARAADEGVRFEVGQVEAWEGQGRVSIRVVRSGNAVPLNQAHVAYRMSDMEAKAGSDYVSSEGTVLLGVGQAAATIETFLLDDHVVEDPERFEVLLVDPDDRSRVFDRSLVTITDDDEPADTGARVAAAGGTPVARQRTTVSTAPPPSAAADRPSPAPARAQQPSAAATSRPKATPFRLYSPPPTDPAFAEPPRLSPARALSIVAAVLLASVAARAWARWRLGDV